MRQLAVFFMGSLLLFGIACGGKVVVESTGATGTGGAGGTGTTTTTSSNGDGGYFASTGDVSPVGVVSSSSGGQTLCQQICDKQTSKGCNAGPTCVSDCENTYQGAGACAPQLDAYVECLLMNNDPGCMDSPACSPQAAAYNACSSPSACNGTTSCSSTNNGSCDCQTSCNGSTFEVQCSPGNAMDYCLCIKDGMPINKCAQPQGTGLSCDIVKGCCGSSFFPVNGP